MTEKFSRYTMSNYFKRRVQYIADEKIGKTTQMDSKRKRTMNLACEFGCIIEESVIYYCFG